MTLAKLIEAVEAGTFLMNVLPEHEATAYQAFSGSLDAAKRLHDALLPGSVTVCITQRYGGGFHARLFDWVERVREDGSRWWMEASAWSDNPARAWLLAILRALEQEGPKDG